MIVGVDGEGQNTPDGRHVYTFLCAVREDGKVVSESRFAAEGLSMQECIDVLLKIPRDTLKFGYMFSYDVTKIIEELSLKERYYLIRPETRKVRKCLACGYRFRLMSDNCPKCKSSLVKIPNSSYLKHDKIGFDYFNGSLSVADGKHGKGWTRSCKVNDCFRFFGCAFVKAIENWEVGSPEQINRIRRMKLRRGDFENETPKEVMAYCREECELLAKMMRKLIVAHENAGIPLEQYHGAGSTATALLKKHDVDLYRGPSYCEECKHEFVTVQRECPKCEQKKTVKVRNLRDLPSELQFGIMSAYFGGRFENSGIGFVDNPVWSNDIASAYPYALTFMPCLRCGIWSRYRTNAVLALHKYRVRNTKKSERKNIAWMPLPFRTDEGSICYPTGFVGWGWDVEVQSAIHGWPGFVEILETWYYTTDCNHKPFGFMPEYYKLRISWGKEGRGVVIKLGMNASYGKAAQVKGGTNPPFQSWIWAGLTTATTRAQLNDAIASAKDRWNVHAVATDGIYASEELACAIPKDTNTFGIIDPKGEPKMALGGWESNIVKEGAFFLKPGLYWKQGNTAEDIKAKGLSKDEEDKAIAKAMNETRARGVGRREAYEKLRAIENAFLAWDRSNYKKPQVTLVSTRFHGAKNSILMGSYCKESHFWPGPPEKGCPKCGRMGVRFNIGEMGSKISPAASGVYGTWSDHETAIAFDPAPKREREHRLQGRARYARMVIRDMGGKESMPYRFATTPEGEKEREFKDLMLDQPDWEEEDMEDDIPK